MKIGIVAAGAMLIGLAISTLGLISVGHTADDVRTKLDLNDEQNASVRSEMRKLLASVADIVEAIDDNDFAAVETAARKSGMSMAAQVEVSLKEKLPGPFMKLGKSVHVGFDKIADAASAAGATKNKIVSLLGQQLQRCVACHATYGLE